MLKLISALTVTNLVKTYGGVRAVNGTSFSVEKSSIFALLGIPGNYLMPAPATSHEP